MPFVSIEAQWSGEPVSQDSVLASVTAKVPFATKVLGRRTLRDPAIRVLGEVGHAGLFCLALGEALEGLVRPNDSLHLWVEWEESSEVLRRRTANALEGVEGVLGTRAYAPERPYAVGVILGHQGLTSTLVEVGEVLERMLQTAPTAV